MAPAGRAARTVMLVMAPVLLLMSSFVTCTDETMQTAESVFAGQNTKDTKATWSEWAQDKMSEGFGFMQDDDKGAVPPPADLNDMVEKSKIDFDGPLSASDFDISDDARDAVGGGVGGLPVPQMSQGATGQLTDAYDNSGRKKEVEGEISKP